MYYSIMLFVCCQNILDYREILTKKQVQLMGAFVRGLGFHSLAKHIEGLIEEQKGSAQKVRLVACIFMFMISGVCEFF